MIADAHPPRGESIRRDRFSFWIPTIGAALLGYPGWVILGRTSPLRQEYSLLEQAICVLLLSASLAMTQWMMLGSADEIGRSLLVGERRKESSPPRLLSLATASPPSRFARYFTLALLVAQIGGSWLFNLDAERIVYLFGGLAGLTMLVLLVAGFRAHFRSERGGAGRDGAPLDFGEPSASRPSPSGEAFGSAKPGSWGLLQLFSPSSPARRPTEAERRKANRALVRLFGILVLLIAPLFGATELQLRYRYGRIFDALRLGDRFAVSQTELVFPFSPAEGKEPASPDFEVKRSKGSPELADRWYDSGSTARYLICGFDRGQRLVCVELVAPKSALRSFWQSFVRQLEKKFHSAE